MNSKPNPFPALLTTAGVCVAIAGIVTQLPAAQTHFAAGESSAITTKLLTWLLAVLPGVAAQIWQSLKDRNIDVGPVENVNAAILLLLDAVVKKEPVAKVVVILKNGQERSFILDEAGPAK